MSNARSSHPEIAEQPRPQEPARKLSPEASAALNAGLESAKTRPLVDLGDFSKYLADDED